MSLLVNNTLANPTTSFYSTGGAGPTPPPSGNSLQSPASIVPAVDGSVSLGASATSGGATLTVAGGPAGATAGTGTFALSGGNQATQTITGVNGTSFSMTTANGSASMSVVSQAGSGAAGLTVQSIGGSTTSSVNVVSNNASALSVSSGGVSPATVSVNAGGTGAAIVGVVATAGAATLNVEANGAGNNATLNLESPALSQLNVIGADAVVQIGGTVAGPVTPGLWNAGDGVIRVSNALTATNAPSEVLTADVVNLTLKVKGLGGAPQVLLAQQNIAPGNVTPTTFTIPNPTGEGLYCIMAASSTVGGPSTQNSRDAQFSMMAYVNAAGRIQIGGNGGTTVGSVTGTESLEIYPLDGTSNLFMTYNGASQLNNMSVVAFNISGPIPSAF